MVVDHTHGMEDIGSMADIADMTSRKANGTCYLLTAGFLALVMSTGFPSPVAGQSGAVVVFVNGGYHNTLTDLAVGTGDRLRSAFAAGGGLSLMLGRNVAFRGHVSRVAAKYDGPTLAVQDSTMSRLFYGGDIMVGRATEAGIAPYLFGGVGAVSTDARDPDLRSFTKLAGRVGAGFNYPIDGSSLTPFFEGSFWIYGFNRFGFDRTLVDFSATVGVALAVPF